jgi:hypothetical protein
MLDMCIMNLSGITFMLTMLAMLTLFRKQVFNGSVTPHVMGWGAIECIVHH